MNSPAHRPRGTASDSLLVQVNVDNVLQVRNVLHKEQRDVESVLGAVERNLSLQPAGWDPVSRDVTPRFQAKIDEIRSTHWAHVAELHEATERLREAARHYGFTDDEIDASFAQHDEAIGPIFLDR